MPYIVVGIIIYIKFHIYHMYFQTPTCYGYTRYFVYEINLNTRLLSNKRRYQPSSYSTSRKYLGLHSIRNLFNICLVCPSNLLGRWHQFFFRQYYCFLMAIGTCWETVYNLAWTKLFVILNGSNTALENLGSISRHHYLVFDVSVVMVGQGSTTFMAIMDLKQ